MNAWAGLLDVGPSGALAVAVLSLALAVWLAHVYAVSRLPVASIAIAWALFAVGKADAIEAAQDVMQRHLDVGLQPRGLHQLVAQVTGEADVAARLRILWLRSAAVQVVLKLLAFSPDGCHGLSQQLDALRSLSIVTPAHEIPPRLVYRYD